MTMKQLSYAFFPGCVSKGACRELYDSTVLITEILGIHLVELDSASCCGAGVVEEIEPKTADALNTRNLAMASKLKLPLMTQCSTCQGVLSRVNYKLQNDKTFLEEMNSLIKHQGHEYDPHTEVKHLLWVLVQDYGLENVAKHVKHALRGIKLASFYGCYLLRPSKVMQFEKDPQHPESLENVFKTLGAEPVIYDGRVKCCGFPISMMDTKSSFTMAGNNLLEAKEKGADAIVTPCPLCHLNLDARQPDIEKVMGKNIDLPILHLSQVVGLALGVEPKKLKLDKHIVSTKKFLEKVKL